MIERVDYKKLTYKKFLEEYADKKPVIIKGIVEQWPCYKWDLKYLQKNYGDRDTIIRTSSFCEENKFYQAKLGKFINLLENNKNEEKFYCDWPFSIMGNEDIEDAFETPFYFSQNTIRSKNNKKLKWIFLGSKHTGTPLHQDIEQTHNWNAIIFGQKKWVFFSPEDTQDIQHLKVDLFSENKYENSIFKESTPYYINQYHGEIMYTPKNWWHAVLNLDTTFAISENFWYKQEYFGE